MESVYFHEFYKIASHLMLTVLIKSISGPVCLAG